MPGRVWGPMGNGLCWSTTSPRRAGCKGWRALTFRSCLSLLCNRRVSTHTTVSVSQRMHALATDHSFLSLYPPCAAAQQQSWAMQGWGLLGIRCPRDLPTPYLTASMRRSPWSPVRGSCYGSWRWNGEWGYLHEGRRWGNAVFLLHSPFLRSILLETENMSIHIWQDMNRRIFTAW